jgi:hypothetical protein
MTAVQFLQIMAIIIIGACIGDRLLTCSYNLMSSSIHNRPTSPYPFVSSFYDVSKTGRRRTLLSVCIYCRPYLRVPRNPSSPGRGYLDHLAPYTTTSPATRAILEADKPYRRTSSYTDNRDRYKDDLGRVGMQQILTSLVDKHPDNTYLVHESTDTSSEDLSLYVKRKHPDGTTEWLGSVAEVTRGEGFHVKLHHADAEVVREYGWATNGPGRKVRWSWLLWLGTSLGCQWVGVHGARGTEDLAILEGIVRAAIGCAASGDGMEWDEEATAAGNEVH